VGNGETAIEMRNSGRLVPGKHFKRKGRFIFYDAAGLKKIFTKKEVAA
jgi:hypothetical protein